MHVQAVGLEIIAFAHELIRTLPIQCKKLLLARDSCPFATFPLGKCVPRAMVLSVRVEKSRPSLPAIKKRNSPIAKRHIRFALFTPRPERSRANTQAYHSAQVIHS
jgi:hypothetical protein